MFDFRVAVLTLLLTISRLGVVIAHRHQPLSFDPAHYPTDSVITRDVAIIGGGSGGVYTAIRAKDSHKSVVVIEKKGRLGGHTETYTDPATGRSINYGVVVWHDLPLVKNYFARLNVNLTKLDFGNITNRYVDFTTGKDVPGVPRDFSAGIAAYIAKLTEYPDLDKGFFLPDPVPEDLLLPFADYVEKYPAIKPAVFYLFFSTQGLGDFLRLPTVYIFKNWGLDVLRNVQNGFLTTASGNNSELYRNAGVVLGQDVLLNSCVIATERKAGAPYVKLVVKTASGLKLILAKKLVITIPPLPETLRAFDLGKDELSLFRRFSSKGYYTGVVRDSGIPLGTAFTNAAPNTPYNVPPFPGFYTFSPTAVPGLFDFKYGSDTLLPDAQVKADVIAKLDHLHQVGTFNKTSSKPEIFIYSSHSPFEVNVPAKDIADGFYRKLYALQGKRQTYYTGAAFHSHDSSLIWSYTESNVIPGITA